MHRKIFALLLMIAIITFLPVCAASAEAEMNKSLAEIYEIKIIDEPITKARMQDFKISDGGLIAVSYGVLASEYERDSGICVFDIEGNFIWGVILNNKYVESVWWHNGYVVVGSGTANMLGINENGDIIELDFDELDLKYEQEHKYEDSKYYFSKEVFNANVEISCSNGDTEKPIISIDDSWQSRIKFESVMDILLLILGPLFFISLGIRDTMRRREFFRERRELGMSEEEIHEEYFRDFKERSKRYETAAGRMLRELFGNNEE